MSTPSPAMSKQVARDTAQTLPRELWELILSMLPFEQQHELSSLCKVFCEAARPSWIEVAPPGGQGAAALDPWVKSSLVEALGAFGRFRQQHPRRLFQIRLSSGMHDSGFVKYDGSPLVIGEGDFRGLRLRSSSWGTRSSPRNWDGLHIQSAEFVAVCGTYGVTSVTLPEGLQEVEENAFEDCDSLTSVTLPQGLRVVGNEAFYGCSSLTSVTLPEGLQEVEDSAFAGCTSLTSVTLPEGLQEVGGWAFDGCTSLTSVTLPDGLQKVGINAFDECSSLTSVTLPRALQPLADADPHLCECQYTFL